MGELTPRHEEVFRALHAATIHVHTLTKEVNCLHGGNKVKQRTTAQLIGEIKKELTAMVATCKEGAVRFAEGVGSTRRGVVIK